MTERQAKQHLQALLESYTPGSVLHLIADHFEWQGVVNPRLTDFAFRDQPQLSRFCPGRLPRAGESRSDSCAEKNCPGRGRVEPRPPNPPQRRRESV
jgi:hypothetical protein